MAENAASAIKLPITLSSHPSEKQRLGLAFKYDGGTWTATDSYWREGVVYYRISERADGLGPWRELSADDLAEVLRVQ